MLFSRPSFSYRRHNYLTLKRLVFLSSSGRPRFTLIKNEEKLYLCVSYLLQRYRGKLRQNFCPNSSSIFGIYCILIYFNVRFCCVVFLTNLFKLDLFSKRFYSVKVIFSLYISQSTISTFKTFVFFFKDYRSMFGFPSVGTVKMEKKHI